jgi:hypothetical protein
MPTLFRAAADVALAAHATFVVFVVAGGLLVLRWRWIAWVHVPAAVWGVTIELAGWICPLTPLENYLLQRAGSSGYRGEFIEHYVLPLLYPVHLTRELQIVLGVFAFAVNLLIYSYVVRAARRAPGRS